ncbi:MAG: GIY-YIG nuclease family protein [Alphaproteobacteria bacterium]
MKQYFVYIMTNANNTTNYIGVTSDLIRRVYEHKNDLSKKAFTKYYNLHKLVYFECHNTPEEAIAREKYIKKAHKKYKNQLINKQNLDRNDLYDMLVKSI